MKPQTPYRRELIGSIMSTSDFTYEYLAELPTSMLEDMDNYTDDEHSQFN